MKTLFICSANIWRSQIAEWYYNHFTRSHNWSSAALIEDRREKYNFKPAESIVEIMKEDWIDISSQEVSLLTKEACDEVDRIIILLDIDEEQDSDFTINWENPRQFLWKYYRNKCIIRKVQDPFWETDYILKNIRNEIKKLVQQMS